MPIVTEMVAAGFPSPALDGREEGFGDVVVAVLDGELTVKRLLSRDGRPMLHAENPRYPDFVPSEHGDVVIWGVVTGSFHPQRRLRRK